MRIYRETMRDWEGNSNLLLKKKILSYNNYKIQLLKKKKSLKKFTLKYLRFKLEYSKHNNTSINTSKSVKKIKRWEPILISEIISSNLLKTSWRMWNHKTNLTLIMTIPTTVIILSQITSTIINIKKNSCN